MTKDEMAELHVRATRASREAHQGIPDTGPVGFGWVWMKGTLPFARWAKKSGIAHEGYPNGTEVWMSTGKQAVAANAAAAEAYAKTLREAGIRAQSRSRLD